MVWNYLLWHLFGFWCKPALSTRGGSSGLKLQYFFPLFTTKLEFCDIFQRTYNYLKICLYHSKASLFVSIKLVPLFHEHPPDGTWELSLKRGGNVFRQSWKYNMFDQIFFQLVFWFISKMTILSIFHPLRIFWRLKLRGQSIRFCTASYLHGTPMSNLYFCVLFVHRYFFSKWYHCTSFKLDLLFVSYKLYLSRF